MNELEPYVTQVRRMGCRYTLSIPDAWEQPLKELALAKNVRLLDLIRDYIREGYKRDKEGN